MHYESIKHDTASAHVITRMRSQTLLGQSIDHESWRG